MEAFSVEIGFWLNQALGLLGSLIVLSSVQFNNRKIILAAQAVACTLWLVHYSVLGAATAAATNIISFARSIVFAYNDRPWAKKRFWLWLFLGLFILNSIVTWEGARSILPAVAMCLTTLALWTHDLKKTRFLYLANSPFWLSYDLISGSYSTALIECCALVSYILAVWRYDFKKQPQN